jgi:hypothetical protein
MEKAQAGIERQLQGFDESLEQSGRKGPERLTDAERGQLIGIAMRAALFWGVGAEIVTILAIVALAITDGFSQEDWWGLANGPIVAVLYFLFKRRSMLNRAAAMAADTRRRLGAQLTADRIQREVE